MGNELESYRDSNGVNHWYLINRHYMMILK